jgi:polysaccharide deacetylase family protein (PEP-CTERM system associated)
MKHALTIDVEDYFQVAAFKSNVNPQEWDTYRSRVELNTHRFMEITAEHDVRATFFFLGWIAERYPNLVREVVAAGHEIGCHGYSHQLIYEQSSDLFREETHRAKALLEDQIQKSVKGYRAASYSITDRSLWALDTIADAEFEFDSSIYPIRHDNYGLPGGPHEPYRIELANGRSIVEFPITTAPVANFSIPVGGGGYFRIFPYALTRKLLHKREQEVDAPFVFYLHPWELDPQQPRIRNASLKSRFRHYTNLNRVAPRLHRLLSEFDFAPMGEVLEQCRYLQSHSYG